MAGAYDIKDSIRLTAKFKNAAEELADPSSIIFKFKYPDNTIISYEFGVDSEVVRTGIGTYYVDIDVNNNGIHYYRWEASGDLKVASESKFTVKQSQF